MNDSEQLDALLLVVSDIKDACRRLTNDMEYIEKRKAINIIRADLQEMLGEAEEIVERLKAAIEESK